MHAPPLGSTVRPNRQRDRTRDALMSAGHTLFANRPVEGVTVDDIVDQAQVAKGSFYNHFSDKDAFADAVYQGVQSDVERQIATVNEGVVDPPVRIARALCTVMAYARDNPERLQALLGKAPPRTAFASPTDIGVEADVRAGLDQGRFRDIDVEGGVLCAIAIIQAMVGHTMVHDGRSVRPVDLAAKMAGALLRALGLPRDEASALAGDTAESLLGVEQ